MKHTIAETRRDFQVRKDDIATVRWVESHALNAEDLDAGQVLVDIERFALTANNITYAVTGDSIGYWGFFLAPQGWGRVPVWGFGEIMASRADGVEAGERIYGFFPMSSQLVMTPAKVEDEGFFDATEERRAVSSVYDYYRRWGTAPGSNVDRDDLVALFQPLLMTAFLLEDHLAEVSCHGADQIVITSASSKTAIGTAHFFRTRRGADHRPELVGLTSARNRAFVESTGYYDRVFEYDGVASLAAGPEVLVIDFAGHGPLKEKLKDHLDRLIHVVLVGVTHHEDVDLAPAGDETFFFAPSQSQKRVQKWGREGFDERYHEAAEQFFETTGTWLQLNRKSATRLEPLFREVLHGARDPAEGLIFLF